MRALTRHLAIAAALMSVLTGTAFADTPWQQAHPRREAVNQRLANQNRRIRHEVKEGEMSHAQPRACTVTTARSAGKSGTWLRRIAATSRRAKSTC